MNIPQSNDDALQELLRATVNYISNHSATAVERFKPACRNSLALPPPIKVAPRQLPVTEMLTPALALSSGKTRHLLSLYEQYRDRLFFEQSYGQADTAVSEQMLAGYGFAELVGERGPFVSEFVRIGIGIWTASLDYPVHRHRAEEVYILLAGSAQFWVDSSAPESNETTSGAREYTKRRAGDVVWVPSNTQHGFRTTHELVVVVYIWQNGDLREKSTFESALI